MAVIVRLKAAAQFHDSDPKNQAVINPVVNVTSALFNGDALCQELADKMGLLPGIGATTPIHVRSYDVQGTKPVFPNGQADKNPTGTPKVLSIVPELAVCLSFYAGQNRARRRGRLYMPAWMLGATASDATLAVPSGIRNAALAFANTLAGLGGADVDWGVWSSADGSFHKATNVFVSDAWAVQRRRGIKETARSTATTSG